MAILAFAAAGAVIGHWPRTVYFGIPAVCLVAGALGVERHLRAAALRPLLFLGAASYSLYLTHLLTIDAVRLLWMGAIESSLIVTAVMVVVAGAVGCAFYALVERPLLLLGQRRRRIRVAFAPVEATTS